MGAWRRKLLEPWRTTVLVALALGLIASCRSERTGIHLVPAVRPSGLAGVDDAGAFSIGAEPPAPSQVLLAWCPEVADVLLRIVAAIPEPTRVVVLAAPDEQSTVLSALDSAARPVALLPIPTRSPWIRDFGPLLGRDAMGRVVFIDAAYDETRPDDDAVPRVLASTWRARNIALPLKVEGGNLISDGEGRCFTTRRLLERNLGYGESGVQTILRDRLGCSKIVWLPRIRGERTGHVDIQLAIVGDVALVAAPFRTDDPEADTLDVTARLVEDAFHEGAGGRAVVRVPLARGRRLEPLSYVQILALQDRVLVPSYRDVLDGQGRAAEGAAHATLATAFPSRKIIPIKLDSHIELGGGVHCYALGLP